MTVEATAEQRIKALVRLVNELEQRAIFWEAAYWTLTEQHKDKTT